MKVLIIRNDKIGDFVLALPAIKALKEYLPDAQISVLVPKYTIGIAEQCSFIDEIIIDQGEAFDSELTTQLIQEEYDVSICLFSSYRNAMIVKKSKIKIRVAPATKWIQILYTHTLKQRRSQSIKPEYQYNLELIEYVVNKVICLPKCKKVFSRNIYPIFKVNEEEKQEKKLKLSSLGLKFENPLVFLHPSTGGSSGVFSISDWKKLILWMNDSFLIDIVLTAAPNDKEVAVSLYRELNLPNVYLYDSNDGLIDFTKSISIADVFVAGSTGPLHLASALDVPTLGLYPIKKSSSALRWQTMNSSSRRFALSFETTDSKQLLLDPLCMNEELHCWLSSFLSQ